MWKKTRFLSSSPLSCLQPQYPLVRLWMVLQMMKAGTLHSQLTPQWCDSLSHQTRSWGNRDSTNFGWLFSWTEDWQQFGKQHFCLPYCKTVFRHSALTEVYQWQHWPRLHYDFQRLSWNGLQRIPCVNLVSLWAGLKHLQRLWLVWRHSRHARLHAVIFSFRSEAAVPLTACEHEATRSPWPLSGTTWETTFFFQDRKGNPAGYWTCADLI